ncbi:MAG: transposase [Treponema sp.]|nr:transposase [Treponema sp.]
MATPRPPAGLLKLCRAEKQKGHPALDIFLKQIYGACRKRCGRAKFLLSVAVSILEDGKAVIPARIVCVRNRNNRKDWIAFICTDMSLSEEEIISVYGKRWKIEVFFKTCKTMLNLGSECHSLSYDALTAHESLVFIRYMFLALQNRLCEDGRSFGELFFSVLMRLRTSALIVQSGLS